MGKMHLEEKIINDLWKKYDVNSSGELDHSEFRKFI